MSLLGEALLHPNVTVVQALLLLCNSLGAQGAASNGPVLYLRIGGYRKVLGFPGGGGPRLTR
jgi:hypothetical protein